MEASKDPWIDKNEILHESVWISNHFLVDLENVNRKNVKNTGSNTQCRIDCFCSQVAKRFYETMLLEIAKKTMERKFHSKYALQESRDDIQTRI